MLNNFILFLVSYVISYYIIIQESGFLILYQKLLFYECLVWFFTFFHYRKYRVYYLDFGEIIAKVIKASFFLLLSVSLLIVFLKMAAISQWHVIVHISIYAFFELLLVHSSRVSLKQVLPYFKSRVSRLKIAIYSPKIIAGDFLLFILAFVFTLWLKYDKIYFDNTIFEIFIVSSCLWFFSGVWTRKFVSMKESRYPGIYHVIVIFAAAVLVIVSFESLFIFVAEKLHFSRMLLYAPAVFLFLLELPIVVVLYYCYSHRIETNDVISPIDVEHVTKIRTYETKARSSVFTSTTNSFSSIFNDIYTLFHENYIFDFVKSSIDLNTIGKSLSQIFFNPFKATLSDHSEMYQLLFHCFPLNNIYHLNRYLLSLNQLLKTDGYLAGSALIDTKITQDIFTKYPRVLSEVIITLKYLFYRVFPKLPFFNHLYHVFSNNKQEMLSRTEVLGRLAFCGFRIINDCQQDGTLYFVVQKNEHISAVENPLYGPIVKLPRIGYQDRLFNVYKLRTMHSYSEFIQDYVYEMQGTINGDKANNDFRVPEWGKLLRKLWIDELPMLYNLLIGDLKLIGVRPLSVSKFKMYPVDLQQFRTRFKPGLIPPFYVDLPKSFEEHIASEQRYLEAYMEKPLRTDFFYLRRALYNIVFKRARSG
jgi:lipopolysaccharide/colanic/teichoic acid biosynthesis glycosyltransferase